MIIRLQLSTPEHSKSPPPWRIGCPIPGKILGFMFLLCFSFSLIAEAKSPPLPSPSSLTNKHTAPHHLRDLALRKKAQQLAAAKKTPANTTLVKRPQPLKVPLRPQSLQQRGPKPRQPQELGLKRLPAPPWMKQQQTIVLKKPPPHLGVKNQQTMGLKKQQPRIISPVAKHQQMLVAKNGAQPKTQIIQQKIQQLAPSKRLQTKSPLPLKRPPIKRPLPLKSPISNTDRFEIEAHVLRNAISGGLPHLYSKNLFGQGQVVGVVEYSGEWQDIKNAMNRKTGTLPHRIRERYKRQFLPPIGGPGSNPEVANDWIRRFNDGSHGSGILSILFDYAPQARGLPVSTSYGPQQNQDYDLADALMDLSKRKNVGVINVSSGWFDGDLESKLIGRNADGSEKYTFKWSFPRKHLDAFKAVAKAGKVVVIAAGNDGGAIQSPQFSEKPKVHQQFIGYLLQNLDAETRKSIVFAGALDPNMQIAAYSNRPGTMVRAQERFLCAPGRHRTSYSGVIDDGSSNAAPYISAILANLCSKGRIQPRRALELLINSATKRPNRRLYGSGIVNAGAAEKMLERANALARARIQPRNAPRPLVKSTPRPPSKPVYSRKVSEKLLERGL